MTPMTGTSVPTYHNHPTRRYGCGRAALMAIREMMSRPSALPTRRGAEIVGAYG
jgi:hypothetical protein